jgi:hypothetical protein
MDSTVHHGTDLAGAQSLAGLAPKQRIGEARLGLLAGGGNIQRATTQGGGGKGARASLKDAEPILGCTRRRCSP